jgi:hypothetical protein
VFIYTGPPIPSPDSTLSFIGNTAIACSNTQIICPYHGTNFTILPYCLVYVSVFVALYTLYPFLNESCILISEYTILLENSSYI